MPFRSHSVAAGIERREQQVGPIRGDQLLDIDEAQQAKAVARHLGTDHEELYVTGAQAMDVIPQLPRLYDEPFAGLDPISMGVTANLIRKLNDALGSTSILVSHDVHESFSIADHVYFLSQGRIVAHGTPHQMQESDDPYVRQFVHAEADGPVPFHYPGRGIAEQLGMQEGA